METRELTCIGCPMGCGITVKMEGGEVLEVTGNSCRVGDQYARREVTNPTRIVTTSVPVTGGDFDEVSVKTDRDIPKRMIFEVAAALRDVKAEAPVSIGDVIVRDICGTGADIVATRNVHREG